MFVLFQMGLPGYTCPSSERMKSDGSQQEQVTSDTANNWFPHPSPDGKWLVFLSYETEVTGHPANQPVLVMLLLAITDQFDGETGELARRAREVLGRLTDPYQRAYYAGIIAERLAHAQLGSGALHAEAMAASTLRSAMASFEEAERLRQPGNDDAILRWNTCQRTLDRMRRLEVAEEQYEPSFGE